jgi:hypothetical protein
VITEPQARRRFYHAYDTISSDFFCCAAVLTAELTGRERNAPIVAELSFLCSYPPMCAPSLEGDLELLSMTESLGARLYAGGINR